MSEDARQTKPASPYAAIALTAVIFINLLGFGIIIPLLPFYAKSFDAPAWQIALIFSAYSIGSFFGEPLWGRLSDRFGRKPILILTITGNCLCYLALAFAPNILAAFLIRLVGGLASGNGAVIQGYLADVTPPEQLTRQMSYQGAAWNVGMIVGPSLGGILANPDAGPEGFRLPLFVASALAGACVLAILVVIRESNHRREVEVRRTRLLSGLKDTVENPVLGRLMLLSFIVGFAFTGIESIFGLWANERFGWTPREIGVCFAFVGVAAAISQMFLTGPLSERFGEGRMLAVGMSLTVLGSGLLVVSPGSAATIALMCVTAVGQSVAFPNVASMISRTADPHRQGQIQGLNNACGALSRVAGPLSAGLVFPLNINAPFLLGAALVVPAIFLALSASRLAPRPRSEV